ncbi:MAG TPA: RluA family pseudouridine synthase [Holophagaceae bacterium]|nr:RluA family pseudouridine synthase [Holophagaceae bacterium]
MNQGWTYREILGPRDEGRTLLAHLAARYAHTESAEWRARIEAGLVLLDGRPARAEDRLTRGQTLAWIRPPWEEPEAPLVFAVLHEDEDLVAVAKPSGLPTNPGGGFLEHTLLHLVRRRYPGASPVHRLGRGTSGLVLFARTAAAGATLSAALRDRKALKIYRALVAGAPQEDAFVVDAPIGPVLRNGERSIHAASADGKPALSRVRVLERREGSSLVEVRIETGRPHQIRIHMAASGCPLVGDPLYAPGGGFLPGEATPGDLGYRLHAWRLGLPHPRTGAALDLECCPPADLACPEDFL